MFLSDEGPTLQTLKFAFHIGSTPTFLYFDLKFVVLLTYTEAPLRAGLSIEAGNCAVSPGCRTIHHHLLYFEECFRRIQFKMC